MKDTISARRFFSVPTKEVDNNGKMPIHERLDSFLKVRTVCVKANKPGERIDICQISDVHFNYLNAEDFEEANPAVMSSCQYRKWLKGGESIKNAIKALEYGSHCDQTVITGDILDYFTKGALECTKKYIWNAYPDTVCALGGHDVTCNMQGLVPDTMPLEEKYKALQSVWNHDILYYSRIIQNRVMIIQMNNDLSKYTQDQYAKLKNDIADAKEKGLILLIFQHEPMSTGNPKDTDVKFIRTYDDGDKHDYFNMGAGCADSDQTTKDVYELIVSNADIVKGVFCGHRHNDIYLEIKARYTDDNGNVVETIIPQYVLTANAYENGNVLHIVIE